MSRDREKVVGNNMNWGFFGWENSFSQSLTALPAPSGREPLAKRESFTVLPRAPSLRGLSPKVTGGVKLPLSGELASVCETERVFS